MDKSAPVVVSYYSGRDILNLLELVNEGQGKCGRCSAKMFLCKGKWFDMCAREHEPYCVEHCKKLPGG